MLPALFVSFFWSLAEGMAFFIVPDVAISFISIKGVRAAVLSTILSVLGSVVAACILYLILTINLESSGAWLKSVWSHLPGYYPAMLETAREHLRADHARGLLTGPTSGIPYRFYVLESYLQNISLTDLLVWTPIARLQRIVIAPIAVLAIKFGLEKLKTRMPKVKWLRHDYLLISVIVCYWIATYIWYWLDFLPNVYGGKI